MTNDEVLAGLQAAVAVVTARLHAREGRSSTEEALAVEANMLEEFGDDLVTSLASLAVGLVELAAVLQALTGKPPKSPAELLQIVALRLAQPGP